LRSAAQLGAAASSAEVSRLDVVISTRTLSVLRGGGLWRGLAQRLVTLRTNYF